MTITIIVELLFTGLVLIFKKKFLLQDWRDYKTLLTKIKKKREEMKVFFSNLDSFGDFQFYIKGRLNWVKNAIFESYHACQVLISILIILIFFLRLVLLTLLLFLYFFFDYLSFLFLRYSASTGTEYLKKLST